MKRFGIFIIALTLLAACSPAPTAQPTVDMAAIQTSAAQTFIAEATRNAPTQTPFPTNTPQPTRTPLPTSTFTPTPQPITLTGTGDSIVDIQKSPGPAILHLKYTGGGNFAVRNYPANSSTYYDLLVNTIGSYEGTRPLDFKDVEQTARLEIIASGPWEVQVLPISQIRTSAIPGIVTGTGDDVVWIAGGTPDLMKVDASSASRNFVVQVLTNTSIKLVVNEIAPYSGTVLLPDRTLVLFVTATGPWSLEITTK